MRTVNIISLAFAPMAATEIEPHLMAQARMRPDIILLPETCTGIEPQPSDGPLYALCAQAARAGGCYIACGMYRMLGDRRINSMIVFDPDGAVCGCYDKVYPYWEEFDLSPPCTPGKEICVVRTRFGVLGLPICFDANFPTLWAHMAELGTELFLWGSAYSAGTTLQAHAKNLHIPIVTASYIPDCQVYDLTGERIAHHKGGPVLASTVTLDLDACIFHENFNLDKRARLLAEHPEIELIREMPDEQWFVLKSKDPAVSARTLARAYGMEELAAYQARSRAQIDAMRSAAYP